MMAVGLKNSARKARIGDRGAAMLSEVSEGPTMVGGVLAELASLNCRKRRDAQHAKTVTGVA